MRKFKDQLIQDLKSPEYAKAYFETALQDYIKDGDKIEFLTALRDIVEAQGGVGKIHKQSGIPRQTLYSALAEDGNPTIDTIQSMMHSISYRHVSQAHKIDCIPKMVG